MGRHLGQCDAGLRGHLDPGRRADIDQALLARRDEQLGIRAHHDGAVRKSPAQLEAAPSRTQAETGNAAIRFVQLRDAREFLRGILRVARVTPRQAPLLRPVPRLENQRADPPGQHVEAILEREPPPPVETTGFVDAENILQFRHAAPCSNPSSTEQTFCPSASTA